MNFIAYPDTDMLMLSLARSLSRDLRDALARDDRASFAVPGGSTPGPVFDLLSAIELAWDRVDILPGDERWVGEDDPRSNARQIRARLLRDKAAAARFVPLYRAGSSPDAAIDAINAAVEPMLPLDVALVGMGADMHTASLFPGAAQLAEALSEHAPPVLAITAPGAPEPRVTLSARVLASAYALHVVIIGDEKRAAIERAQHMNPMQAPIAALLGQATVHWAR